MKRSCLKKVCRFDPNLSFTEESDFSLKLAQHYQFDYLNKILTIYNLHSHNKIVTKTRSQYLSNAKVKTKHLNLAANKLVSNQTLSSKKILKKLTYHLGLLYLFKGEFKRARKQLIKFIKLKPFSPWAYFYILTSFLGNNLFFKHIVPRLPSLEHYAFMLKQLLPQSTTENH